MESVENKVVLITGGNGVIGSAIVKELLTLNIKGIAIVDKSGNNNINYETTKITFIKADITKSEELEGAFTKTIQTYKQLDIVINNAGLMDEIDWKSTIAVNLTALTESNYLAMKKYLPTFKSGKEGLIINIASQLGYCILDALPVYCATKHGVVALGLCLGSDEFYKNYKVKVLTICPGPVNTPLIMAVNCERFIFPHEMKAHLEKMKDLIQSPENVAKSLVDVIKKGRNGSLWTVESEKAPYEVVEPIVKKI